MSANLRKVVRALRGSLGKDFCRGNKEAMETDKIFTELLGVHYAMSVSYYFSRG